MSFLTDRKRAAGLGSAKLGTDHFWSTKISSVALLFLVPLFVFTVGPVIGEPHFVVLEHFSHPINTLIVASALVVGLLHFKSGVQVLIEDYVHGLTQKISIIAMTIVSYGLIAVVLFALAKIAI